MTVIIVGKVCRNTDILRKLRHSVLFYKVTISLQFPVFHLKCLKMLKLNNEVSYIKITMAGKTLFKFFTYLNFIMANLVREIKESIFIVKNI